MIVADNKPHRNPVCGLASNAVTVFTTALLFLSSYRGGVFDIFELYVAPSLGLIFALIAFIRRERAIWAIIGIILVIIYLGLHFAACC